MDLLNDILSTILIGSVIQSKIYSGKKKWGIGGKGCERAYFALIVQGSGTIQIDNQTGYTFNPGDFFFIGPHVNYWIGSEEYNRDRMFRDSVNSDSIFENIHIEGDENKVEIMCGWFKFGLPQQSLFYNVIPQILCLNKFDNSYPQLISAVNMLQSEANAALSGAKQIMKRLGEIIIILIIRTHFNKSGEQIHWLNALKDPKISLAVESIHEDISKKWTVEMMSRTAGMSRAAFAAQFKKLMNEGPLNYLTKWRMYTAAHLLITTSYTLADVAEKVGYSSELSLNKAFKKQYKSSPGVYRNVLR